MSKIRELIEAAELVENPYPPDVYRWDNEERCSIKTMGRLNQFAYEVFENAKQKVIEALKQK